jgi:PleD family two-component response regulator
MGNTRLLIVEDDLDIATMLRIYFSGLEYEVDIAQRGADALEKTRQVLPHLIILDIMLPDIGGYEVCRALRTNLRTSHIPVIFLTGKDERSDKLQGLELGADDYITKPFDIEELKLRVQGTLRRAQRESLTDPVSGLPAGRLIEEQLRRIIRKQDWALLDVRINHFDSFGDVYGFVAADDVLRFTAMLIGEVIDDLGTAGDFIGHTGGDHFVIITSQAAAVRTRNRLKGRFATEILTHYSFLDREQGFVNVTRPEGVSQKIPFMTLSAGIVSPEVQYFSDIREITELAAESRRQDAATAAV